VANNPRLAKALAELSADLRPGEDPLYIDFRKRAKEAGERHELDVELAPMRPAPSGGEEAGGEGSPWAAGEKIDPAALPSSYATHAAAAPPSTKPVESDKSAAAKEGPRPGRWMALAGAAVLFTITGAALSWMYASRDPAKPDTQAAPAGKSDAPGTTAPVAMGTSPESTPPAVASARVPGDPATNTKPAASAQHEGSAQSTPPTAVSPPPPALHPQKHPSTKPGPSALPPVEPKPQRPANEGSAIF
jgi:hypothetical protein